MPHFALFYEVVPDYLERRGQYRDEHLGKARAAHARGELVMAGAYAEPADGALLVFTTKESAEAFANDDPYVRVGIVSKWRVRTWTTVIP